MCLLRERCASAVPRVPMPLSHTLADDSTYFVTPATFRKEHTIFCTGPRLEVCMGQVAILRSADRGLRDFLTSVNLAGNAKLGLVCGRFFLKSSLLIRGSFSPLGSEDASSAWRSYASRCVWHTKIRRRLVQLPDWTRCPGHARCGNNFRIQRQRNTSANYRSTEKILSHRSRLN